MYREIILRVGNSVLSFIQLSFLGFGRKFPYVDKKFLRSYKSCLLSLEVLESRKGWIWALKLVKGSQQRCKMHSKNGGGIYLRRAPSQAKLAHL